MIVPMKKITLIFDAVKTEETLFALRTFGAFHPSVVKTPVSPEMLALKKKIEVIEKALRFLPKGVDAADDPVEDSAVIALAHTIIETAGKIKKTRDELDALKKELAAIKKWGKTDQGLIRDLAGKGIEIRFFRCSGNDSARFPETLCHFTAFAQRGQTVMGVVRYREVINTDLNFPEVFAPARNGLTVAGLIADREKEVRSLENDHRAAAEKRRSIEKALRALEKELALQTISAGVIRKETVSVLTGFCPEAALGELKQIGERRSWVILSETPKGTDPAPTLVRHTKLSGLFKPVMDFVGIVPAYHEYDASMSFLVFFNPFFCDPGGGCRIRRGDPFGHSGL